MGFCKACHKCLPSKFAIVTIHLPTYKSSTNGFWHSILKTMLLSEAWLEEFQQCIIQKHINHTSWHDNSHTPQNLLAAFHCFMVLFLLGRTVHLFHHLTSWSVLSSLSRVGVPLRESVWLLVSLPEVSWDFSDPVDDWLSSFMSGEAASKTDMASSEAAVDSGVDGHAGDATSYIHKPQSIKDIV